MSHLRQIKKTTRGLLAALGTTPDEVAEQLENTGVQGVPATTGRVPWRSTCRR